MFSLLQPVIDPHCGHRTMFPMSAQFSKETKSAMNIGERNHFLQVPHLIEIDFTFAITVSSVT